MPNFPFHVLWYRTTDLVVVSKGLVEIVLSMGNGKM
jgi:hypothetical protein